jgi:ribosomal protein S8
MNSLNDSISRLKSAWKSGQPYVHVKNTKLVVNVLNLLYKEGFILSYRGDDVSLIVQLQYSNGNCPIKDIKCLSSSSRQIHLRKFAYSTQYTYPKFNRRLIIFSTPNGLSTSNIISNNQNKSGILLVEVI